MSQLGLNPLQRLFLTRLERLVALPALSPPPPLDYPGGLVQQAVASTFADCLQTGVGLEALELLQSWLLAAPRAIPLRQHFRKEDSHDHPD